MTVVVPDIDVALRHPQLLGAALGDVGSWSTWVTSLRATAGLPLDEEQQQIFNTIAGGRPPPKRRTRETWCVVGRGGGKSRMAAAIAVHSALLQQHKLAPGETGFVLVLSQTVAQAKVVFGYCQGFIESSPVLRQEVVGVTSSEIRLRNNIVIGVHPNSFRSVRGRTLLVCIFDEVSFWRDIESANPDLETYRAVLPSLVRSKGQLIAISTPYMQRGLLYQRYRDFFGVDDDDVLVVQADSRFFNPTLSAADIAAASAADPEASLSEWQGLFRVGLSAFLGDADIDSCIDHDRPLELPPRANLTYESFIDPSGGRHDAFAICISHKDGDRTIIDVVRGRQPPFDPQNVVNDYAALLNQYRVHTAHGDGYSADWVVTAFKQAGIKYERSELPKGRLYLEGLPSFTRRTVSLPSHSKLLRELRLLERQAHSGGRDNVDHGRNGSDDLANCVFGCLFYAQKQRPRLMRRFVSEYDGTIYPQEEMIAGEWREVDAPPRTRLVRSPDGGLKLRGGDHSAIPARRKTG